MIEIGAVFQRNDYCKNSNVPNYYVVVISNKSGYIRGRRQIFGELDHEDIGWTTEDFSKYFKEV